MRPMAEAPLALSAGGPAEPTVQTNADTIVIAAQMRRMLRLLKKAFVGHGFSRAGRRR